MSAPLTFALKGFLAELDNAGYVIVPKDPTEDQLEAGYLAEDTNQPIRNLYRAMLDAAPKVSA